VKAPQILFRHEPIEAASTGHSRRDFPIYRHGQHDAGSPRIASVVSGASRPCFLMSHADCVPNRHTTAGSRVRCMTISYKLSENPCERRAWRVSVTSRHNLPLLEIALHSRRHAIPLKWFRFVSGNEIPIQSGTF